MKNSGNIKMTKKEVEVVKEVDSRETGILSCINCIGIHPDEIITQATIMHRLHQPQKVVAIQKMKFEQKRKLGIYNDKSCMLCGRTYTSEGHLDESWELTKERVKAAYEDAGVTGLKDEEYNQIVARCVKSWRYLWKHRAKIKTEEAEMMTFKGRLTYILCHIQEAMEKGKKKILDKELVKQ